MSLKNVDLTAAMRRLADLRIEEAIKEGKFDNLPGSGKDLILDDMPAEEDARLKWWCVRLLRQNDVTPDEVRWRKQIEQFRESLPGLSDQASLTATVAQINCLVHKINTLGANAMQTPVLPLDLAGELARMRRRPR